MTDQSDRHVRPMFVNGEALKVKVERPPSFPTEKHHPRTPEQARETLLPQVQQLTSSVALMPRTLRSERFVYVEARLLPNYVAASHYPGRLLQFIGAVQVGSRADSTLYETKKKREIKGTRRLILAVGDEGLAKLESLIAGPGATQSEQQAFDEIRKFDEISISEPPSVAASDKTGIVTWEAVIHPASYWNQEMLPADESTLEKWKALVEHLKGEVVLEYVRQVGGLTFVPIRLTPSAASEAVRFNPLRSLRPMSAIRPIAAIGLRSAQQNLFPPSNPTPSAPAPSVAVFDGGLDMANAAPGLFPFTATDLTPAAPDNAYLQHGTGVTGVVAYGLSSPGIAPRPPLPIESYRLLPPPAALPGDMGLYWMLDQIKDAVVRDGHRIVNLSLGPQEAVTDAGEPNRWTAELDTLAWEHGVLFVVAAGNDGEADQATGLHRVQVPSDMANGLGVGACDCAAPSVPWRRAPYSSMGPGRQGARVQPAGLQFGGSAQNPFQLLQADGSYAPVTGTSFAAPLMTHALSDLTTRLPRWDANVLRAFAVHFAERHPHRVKLCDEIGRGRFPLSYVDSLECAPDAVHVLYVDEVERFQRLGYQVPIPTRAVGPFEVTITLAYASPVDPTQPTEYTKASLDACFRPHHLMYRFSPPEGIGGKAVDLLSSSDEAMDLLRQGWLQSHEPITKGLPAEPNMPEHQLRDGGKWETLRHARIRLGAGQAEMPRLEISYLARAGGALDTNDTKVQFALLVSVQDLGAAGSLYSSTSAQFGALRPITRARTRVGVRVDAT